MRSERAKMLMPTLRQAAEVRKRSSTKVPCACAPLSPDYGHKRAHSRLIILDKALPGPMHDVRLCNDATLCCAGHLCLGQQAVDQ